MVANFCNTEKQHEPTLPRTTPRFHISIHTSLSLLDCDSSRLYRSLRALPFPRAIVELWFSPVNRAVCKLVVSVTWLQFMHWVKWKWKRNFFLLNVNRIAFACTWIERKLLSNAPVNCRPTPCIFVHRIRCHWIALFTPQNMPCCETPITFNFWPPSNIPELVSPCPVI